MSKMDAVTEMFETNSSLLDWSNAKIMEAFEVAHPGETVSVETIRLAKKTFAQPAAPADNPFAEDEVPAAEQNDNRPETDDEPTMDEVIENLEINVEPDAPVVDAETDDADDREDSPEATAEARTETEPESPDLTGETTATETPADEPIVIDRVPEAGRCNHRMERARDLCGRPLNHPGGHVTYAQMAKKKKFSKDRAKVRYHADPEYAAKIKEASRRSHKKARDAKKAAREAAEAQAKAETPETNEVEAGTESPVAAAG